MPNFTGRLVTKIQQIILINLLKILMGSGIIGLFKKMSMQVRCMSIETGKSGMRDLIEQGHLVEKWKLFGSVPIVMGGTGGMDCLMNCE